MYYRTLVTAEQGVEIDLLTYGEGADVDISGMRIIRIPRFAFLGNVKIGPSFLKLFLDMFMIIWTVALLLRNNYDFIHAHEESMFYCRFLKPFFRFKLVYDMHSSLPQQLTNFNFTKSSLLIKLFKKLEDTCLQSADAVITICPDLAEYAKNLINDDSKHFLIENSIFEPVKIAGKETVNEKKPEDIQNDPIIPKLPEGRPLIVYAGTLEPYQGIEILIRAFEKVISSRPDAFLLIVGGTVAQVELYSCLAVDLELEKKILFTGRVSQQLARRYAGKASVLVSPRSAGSNTPLKIYEMLASGIPFVATNIYAHTQVLDENVAFLVSPDPDDMARRIIDALNTNGARYRVVENACRLYEEKYSRRIYVSKIKRLLDLLS